MIVNYKGEEIELKKYKDKLRPHHIQAILLDGIIDTREITKDIVEATTDSNINTVLIDFNHMIPTDIRDNDNLIQINGYEESSRITSYMQYFDEVISTNENTIEYDLAERFNFCFNSPFTHFKAWVNNQDHNLQLLIKTIIKLLYSIDNQTIVIYRNPELYLSPRYIQKYYDLLSFTLDMRGAQGIFITHSPIIVRELPKECVTIINESFGLMDINKPLEETYGQSISRLLGTTFNVDTEHSGFYDNLDYLILHSQYTEQDINQMSLGRTADMYRRLMLEKKDIQ